MSATSQKTSAKHKATDQRRLACGDCAIRDRAVCSLCSTEEMATLEAIKHYRRFEAGATIAMAGEPLPFVGSVVEGHVALTRMMSDGRRQIVGLLFPSDFIGRPLRETIAYDAEAVDDVLLCTFDRVRFEWLLRRTPPLEERLLEMTLDELDAARETLLTLGRRTAREKVANFLVMVARRQGIGAVAPTERVEIVLPLGRDDMAGFLGLTIETVSRQMTALRREGLIDMVNGAREVTLVNTDTLAEIAGEDGDGGPLA
ncbi:MAG: Crp/Fnr family transcriptional regulator [Pseudomonadota bacterium]